jgi:hypothetical protein
MQNKIAEKLDKVLTFLLKWKFSVIGFLQHGLDKSLILQYFSKINLNPTNEMVQLYSWRNGTNISKGTNLDDIQFIPGFHILSLEDALVQYKSIKDDPRWNRLWFPIMANGGGDFYAVDLSLSNGNCAPVIGFVLGENEQYVEYQSIDAMLNTFLECCVKGVVYRSNEGYLEMDDNKHALIARVNNPEVGFWVQ